MRAGSEIGCSCANVCGLDIGPRFVAPLRSIFSARFALLASVVHLEYAGKAQEIEAI